MEIVEKIIVQGSRGPHLRSAPNLALIANRYQCEIAVRNGYKWANAKSIVGLVSLGAGKGAELEFTFQGDDAEEACRDVQEFFQRASGE